MTAPEYRLADLDQAADPIATLRLAAQADGDGRAGAVHRAVAQMVGGGADGADIATARAYVLREKLLSAKSFDQAVADAKTATAAAGHGTPDPDTGNQATRLLALAEQNYRLIRSEDGEAYGVRLDGPNIAIPLSRGGPFASHLIRMFYEAEGSAPSDDAERTALKIMRARLDEEEPEAVHLRVARHKDSIILDLADKTGACVVVTAEGWSVEPRSPVPFRRGASLPLPEPQRGDDGLAKLRELVNASSQQFQLAVGWLVAALIPYVPHPVLTPRGEQGSGKTGFSRLLQAVIDPSGLKPGALPRDERDFAVRMTAAYVQAFDNVSVIPPWLSDALCRAATGENFVTRTLYTDRDVTILQYSRPIILNTIDAGALSGDLIERSLPLDLDRIPPDKRRAERTVIGDDPEVNPGLYDQLDRDHPVILGAVLDLASAALSHVHETRTGDLPRMADFGKILAAIDAAEGWELSGTFAELVDAETGALIEANPFAARLVDFMEDRQEWHGTATALLEELTLLLPDKDRPPKRWPADATRAGGQLKRLAPSLRVNGVDVDYDREGKRRSRTYKIRKIASAASAASANPSEQGKQADAKADASATADAGGRYGKQPASATSSQVDSRFDGMADAADANWQDLLRRGSACSDDESSEALAATHSYGWPASETGPCSRCREPCHRYGPGSNPLCDRCRQPSPSPAEVALHIRPRR